MPPALRARRFLPSALVAAAIALAYVNALGASFQFDDWNVIVDEPRVAGIAAWWASMPGIRALLKLSYALNHAAGGGAPAFHAVNILIHAGCAGLAFVLLRRLSARAIEEKTRARDVALLATLLFALHPVQTEAVTYVSGRSTSLSALFSLGSLVTWIEGRHRSRAWRLLLSPTCFLGALLAKETAVVVPFAIVLWE